MLRADSASSAQLQAEVEGGERARRRSRHTCTAGLVAHMHRPVQGVFDERDPIPHSSRSLALLVAAAKVVYVTVVTQREVHEQGRVEATEDAVEVVGLAVGALDADKREGQPLQQRQRFDAVAQVDKVHAAALLLAQRAGCRLRVCSEPPQARRRTARLLARAVRCGVQRQPARAARPRRHPGPGCACPRERPRAPRRGAFSSSQPAAEPSAVGHACGLAERSSQPARAPHRRPAEEHQQLLAREWLLPAAAAAGARVAAASVAYMPSRHHAATAISASANFLSRPMHNATSSQAGML